ncbi:hypothetical protein [Streptomyces cahuitamycinicus]|uniref:Integral membrane protein n=1 Tax=Streptomyces cahuitamycinicus TaxID=2070367 RepID=A0A2N8TLN2_9ACTN|nr:hypothetical protein [Streptomyces cahuitamycinicus]PNG19926.1 hypothetical protein C1J00_23090 [Streptomyces cahuitamycinicus]
MPDRSLRLLTFPQLSPQGGERGAVLLRERPSSPPDAPSGGDGGEERGRGSQEDNPFAPPPEGTPDRPWQPRRPSGDDAQDSQDSRGGGPDRSPWGSRWSDRQPGRSSGGFGDRPRSGPDGQGGGQGGGQNGRWDPTDPAQRRARYALLSGMWAFFFALFSWPYVALLLGALALYWAISALRAKPRRTADPDTPAPEQQGSRPQTTAAVSGLVTASLAIALVAASFTAQLVYRDYYTCTTDALTNEAKQSCSELLPEQLRGLLETDG